MPDLPDPASVWQAVLGRLQLDMSKEHFNTFLRPCAGQGWEDGSLVVAAASSFAVSWLELTPHLVMAQEALSRTLGRQAGIRYRAMPAADRVASPAGKQAVIHAVSAPPVKTGEPIPDGAAQGRPRRDAAEPGAPTAAEVNSQWGAANSATCHPGYSFANFIVGQSNQLAYHAANAVGSGHGDAPAGYNPLFLYAASGLGKTHLLHAIGNRALQQNRAVLYVTSEQYTNEFVAAINRRAMHEFRERYRSLDLLLLDDVQFLVGKEQTQESLFHTFNDLHQAGAQIVLTSDHAPQTIAPLADRLRSRFQWGLMADIQPPSLETRLAMLHAWAEGRGVAAPDAVLDLIAHRASHNVRQLQGAFNRVMAMSQLMNVPLTAETAAQQLDAIAGPDPRAELTPERVLQEVARHYRITGEQLLGRSRTAAVARARQVAMYLLIDELGLTPTGVGRFLAGRNHSTVIHGAAKIRDAISSDERLRQAVASITAALSA